MHPLPSVTVDQCEFLDEEVPIEEYEHSRAPSQDKSDDESVIFETHVMEPWTGSMLP